MEIHDLEILDVILQKHLLEKKQVNPNVGKTAQQHDVYNSKDNGTRTDSEKF